MEKLHKKMAAKIFSIFPFTTGKNPAILYEHQENAPVVQWIERQIPVLNVGGSSPFGRTTFPLKKLVFYELFEGKFFNVPQTSRTHFWNSNFIQHDLV